MQCILKCLANGVSLLTGHNFLFSAESGYYSAGIAIDSSCAGVNFFLMLVLSAQLIGWKYTHALSQRLFYLALTLPISLAVALGANISRILILIRIDPLVGRVISHSHLLIGMTVFITVLISFCAGLDLLFKKIKLSKEEYI